MKNSVKIILLVVIVALVTWYFYKPAVVVDDGKEPIKIGVSAPLSGEAASFGDGMFAGVELAMKEINDNGGIDGRILEIVYEDDRCNSKDGASVFNKLINIDKVDVVVGPLCSAAAGPGLPIAQKAGTPVIVFGSAPNLTSIGDFIFRTYPSDNFQGVFAAKYVINDLKKSKIAVLYVKNDWGQGLSDVFGETIKDLGGEVVYNEGIAQENRDLRSFATKIKALDPDAIYFAAYPAVGVAGLKQLRDMGLDIPIIGGDAFESDEIVQSGVADDVMYTIGDISNPDEFKSRVSEVTDKTPNMVTSVAYDAINILADIFEKVGTDKELVRDELKKVSYKGISFPLIEFDKKGDLKEAEFIVKIIKDKKSTVLK